MSKPESNHLKGIPDYKETPDEDKAVTMARNAMARVFSDITLEDNGRDDEIRPNDLRLEANPANIIIPEKIIDPKKYHFFTFTVTTVPSQARFVLAVEKDAYGKPNFKGRTVYWQEVLN